MYTVDTDTTRHTVRVKAGPGRGQRRLRRRLVHRFAGYRNVMWRQTFGGTVHYVPVRGESFTRKRDAERFARKHGGVVYRSL